MPFTDVPVGSYYYDAVLWAVENGITKGTSNTTFSPNDDLLPRPDASRSCWRSEKFAGSGYGQSLRRCASPPPTMLMRYCGRSKENIIKGTTNNHIQPQCGLHQSADRDLPLALQEVTG